MNQDRGTAELAPVTATLAGQPTAAGPAKAAAAAPAAGGKPDASEILRRIKERQNNG